MSGALRNRQQHAPDLDFLGRVIDGVFEGGGPLEPRLPSLFEPKTLAVAATVAHPGDLFGSDEEQASREMPRDRMEAPHEYARNAAPKAAPEVKADREPGVATAPPDRSPGRGDEKQEDRGVVRPLRMNIDAGRDGRPEAPREPPWSLPDVPSGVLLAREVNAMTSEASRQTTAARTPESQSTSLPTARRSERSSEQPVGLVPDLPRFVVEPAPASPRPGRELLPQEAGTPAREHVVNVTIGRVEVRAAPAPPASARPRSDRLKPLSLDDYLKQRGAVR